MYSTGVISLSASEYFLPTTGKAATNRHTPCVNNSAAAGHSRCHFAVLHCTQHKQPSKHVSLGVLAHADEAHCQAALFIPNSLQPTHVQPCYSTRHVTLPANTGQKPVHMSGTGIAVPKQTSRCTMKLIPGITKLWQVLPGTKRCCCCRCSAAAVATKTPPAVSWLPELSGNTPTDTDHSHTVLHNIT
jgi:hypothetical protein